jgi:hypothetical protein
MNKIIFILFISIAFLACKSQKQAVKGEAPEVKIETGTADNDSTEYELVVFDPAYETFLASQPYPKWYYSNEYYRNWNIQYVTEWNYRHDNPSTYGSFYETRIDYNPNIDYGLDLNYRLYQYFQFIEKEYGIVLIPRRGKGRSNGNSRVQNNNTSGSGTGNN